MTDPTAHGSATDSGRLSRALVDAACAGRAWHTLDVDHKRAVCATCPASSPCLALALDLINGMDFTMRRTTLSERNQEVWAGHTMAEIILDHFTKRRRYCRSGHDTHRTGRYDDSRCRECKRLQNMRRYNQKQEEQ